MPQSQQTLLDKVFSYGIDINKQNQKTLQQKILQMYEILEQKTTQNLLLRKQNDDILIQINTINQLFKNNNIDLSQHVQKQPNQYQDMQNSFGKIQKVHKNSSELPFKSHKKQLSNKIVNCPIKQSYSNQEFSEQKLKNCQEYQQPIFEPSYLSPRNSIRKSVQNNPVSYPLGFWQSSQQKQSIKTRKPPVRKQPYESGLQKQLQVLMRQNSAILKRMDLIEESLGQGSSQIGRGKDDDRETNISCNLTSIGRIGQKVSKKQLRRNCSVGNFPGSSISRV